MSSQVGPSGRSLTAGPVTWDGERFSLWSYASVLLRRRRIAFTAPVVAAVLVGVSSYLSPRQYTASASLVAQAPASMQSSINELATQFGLATPRASTESPQFYADLVRSREVLRAIVTKTYDIEGKVPFHGTLVKYFGVRDPDPEAAVIAAAEELRAITSVTTDRNTSIIRVQVATRSPGLSEQIVRDLVNLLNDYNLRRRQSQARAEREFVEARLAQARDSLRAAEAAVTTFYQRNRRFQASPELQAEDARLQRQVSIQQQLYLTLSQNYEAAKIEEVRNTPVITVLERPEGFVQPKARGTITKAFAGFFVSAVLVVVLVLGEDYLKRARAAGLPDYLQFADVLREAVSGVRGLFKRRAA